VWQADPAAVDMDHGHLSGLCGAFGPEGVCLAALTCNDAAYLASDLRR